jgi:hypothetical protein
LLKIVIENVDAFSELNSGLLTALSEAPDVSSGTHIDLEDVTVLVVSDFSPASTGVDWWIRGDSCSSVNFFIGSNAPDVTITANIELDHLLGCVDWLPRWGGWVFTFVVNWAPLLEVNSVKFVNDPDNWTISNRDVDELTSDLLPAVSFFVVRRDIRSSEELMVFVDTHDLAVSY